MLVVIKFLLLLCTTLTSNKIQSTLIYFKWLTLQYVIKPFYQSILTPSSFLISVQFTKLVTLVILIKNITLLNKIGWLISV